jgi:NAD(P)-dependent dehydrogenase (short-subunit alcohol dehydrogenase family)
MPRMSAGALADRVVLVVGGTTGLGLAGARACVAAGARVVVVGRNPESCKAAVAALGHGVLALPGDAALPDTAEAAVELAVREFGKLDALYHVAGGSGRKLGDGPLHEIPPEGWEATLRQNLTSVYASNRAALRRFLEQKTGGSILNMSSVLAFSPSPEHFATHAYAAAKAAVIGLTLAAAAYYAPWGIRVNAVAPALVETPMAARAAADAAVQRFAAAKQPLQGGMGKPGDLDAAVVYFLSDQSRCVTGQVLAVDGGWSVSEGRTP